MLDIIRIIAAAAVLAAWCFVAPAKAEDPAAGTRGAERGAPAVAAACPPRPSRA
ncbi:hypothetical protein OPKNFCMD_1776 [Methylobacterium crusticola]|uniref:Uncharacterized protein n=1 Tax=Methylobacterium crusticola TaxID=1697972 RepID=A0ABQ4QUN0_9HYPH|nr:hypothetical protein [Methylobacterium crusticola]GJD49047.1 hypothetical protein OPKNFCMD_1776 [Methylobacterium crusticola]